MKFEYKNFDVRDFEGNDGIENLNLLGKLGWLLVNVSESQGVEFWTMVRQETKND